MNSSKIEDGIEPETKPKFGIEDFIKNIIKKNLLTY